MKPPAVRSLTICVPPPVHILLHRRHLLELLAQRKDRKLILIHGKAGQGKSCLVADFLSSEHLNARWYRCDNANPDVRSLIEELEGLRSLLPGPEGAELYVILEDLHGTSRIPEVAASIQRLVEESSPRTHWILISRGAPRLSVAGLRAQRNLFELDDSELAFSDLEIAALFGQIYRLELEPETLKRLHELSEGWVTALVHLGEHLALRDPDSQPRELERFLDDRRLATLDEYFAGEVLDLDAQDLHSLTLLSVFSSLSPGLVSHILGPRGAGLLDERLGECYFLKCRDASLGIRAFHPLFSAYLKGRFAALDPEERRTVHARAAEYFRAQGHSDEAVYHLVSGGELSGALELFLPRAEELLESHRLHELRELLELFPEDTRGENSLLLYYEAVTTHLAQPFASRRTLRELLEAFERQGDLPRSATVFSLLLVNYIFYQGNREPVLELVAMAESFLELRNDEIPEPRKAVLQALVSLGRWWTAPDFGEPFAVALRAEETAIALQNQELLVLADLVLARIYLDRGQFEKARGILEATAGLLERHPEYSHYKALLRFLLGDTFFYLGELPRAVEQVERGLDEAVPGFAFATYLKLNRVLYLLYMPDIGNAEEVLEQVRDEPMGGNLYLRYYSVFLLQMLLAYRKGPRERAHYYCRRLLEPENRNLLESDFPYSTLALAENLLSFGEAAQAETLLRSLLERAPADRHPYPNATAWALLGLIAERGDQPEQARRCWLELRGLVEQHDYRNLDICSPELLRQVGDALRGSAGLPPEDPHSPGRPDYSGLPGAGAGPIWAFRRLSPPSRSQPPGSARLLRLYTLGEFRLFVGEVELPPTTLSRQRKVMDLLKLLVVHRINGIVKEVLYDLFWPGYLQKSSRDNLNTIIYRLRKTLGEDQELILTDGTTLSLNHELCRVDADEFLELTGEAERTRGLGQTGQAMELYYRAKALYRGDFLDQDLYYDDIRDERETLRSRYLRLLFELTLMSFDNGENYQALVLAKELTHKDPLCEPAYRLLMIAGALVGARSEVPRIFERLNERLRRAYSIEADPQTETLMRELLGGARPDPGLWRRETLV